MKKLSEHERAFLAKMQAEARSLAGQQIQLQMRIASVLGIETGQLALEEVAVFEFVCEHQDAQRFEAELERIRRKARQEVATA